MSAAEGSLGNNGAADASIADLGLTPGSDDWILTTGIDEPVDSIEAPLPDAPETVASAAAGADEKPAVVDGEESADKKIEEPPVDDKSKEPVKTDEELSEEEKTKLAALPEDQQAAAREKTRRKTFSDHFLAADTPEKMEDVRQHMQARSPSQYQGFEQAVWQNRLSNPPAFCADLHQNRPDLYKTLATEMYHGAPDVFAEALTGRAGVTSEQVTTALDFYDRNKDKITDDAPLSQLNEDVLKEMETYFPDQVPAVRKAMELAARAEASAAKPQDEGKDKADTKVDDTKAIEQQRAAAQEVDQLWDVARDVVGDHVLKLATDPAKGAGINVTDAIRKDAPMLATLMTIKRDVLFKGIDGDDGKPLLPHFQAGLIEFADKQDGFKDKFMNTTRFINARERKNVEETASELNPYADDYYTERLKHPIFKAIDQLIELATKHGSAPAPRFDRQLTGGLPPAGDGRQQSTANAMSDDWLIADALERSKTG